MNYQVEILQPESVNCFTELIKIFHTVFEMKNCDAPSENYLKKLLQKDDFFVLVAKSDDKVVGGLTVYVLNGYYTTKPTAYIYDVAIDTGHQRKGVGRQLLSALLKYCKDRGYECAYVEAESTDLDALAFYRSTSADNEMVAVHFTYCL